MQKTKRYQVRNKTTKTVRVSTVTREDARDKKRSLWMNNKYQNYEIFDLLNSVVIR